MTHATPGRARRGLVALIAGAAFALGLAPPAAQAQLPTAGVIGNTFVNPADTRGTGVLGETITSQVIGRGAASFSSLGLPYALLAAEAEAGPNSQAPTLFARGSGLMRYFVQVNGNTPTVDVVVDAIGAASAVASPGASFVVAASWTLYANTSLSQVLASDEVSSGLMTGGFGDGFHSSVALTFLTGQVYAVELRVDAQAAASVAGSSAQAAAFVDPFFHVAPGVDASAYSFAFSPGIGNAAAVPEPGMAWLWALGLMALSGWRRRPGWRRAG